MSFLFGLFFFCCYLFLGYFFVYLIFCGGVMFDFFLFGSLGFDVSFSLVFDFISLGFFGCISFISSVVFFYVAFYMSGSIDMRRFCWLVALFVFSMATLVFSGSFLLTMIGWDGLGLVSFCLVIFYSSSSSLESGLVTVFSNRIGDVFLLGSFFFLYSSGCLTWDVASYLPVGAFCFFLFLGAITKSAQLPFSAWLPAAMAAPTPVSSLVHSSTLVTAGVYLLIRYNYVFLMMNTFFFSTLFLVTMVFAGLSASLETDLKKIVAMSTLSQLGMMMFVLSVGSWLMSFLHMIIHAFFKSMLFLGTGSMMSQKGGTQDSRFYGNSSYLYSSFLYFVVSCLCLSGFPFLIGFYSKDFIISMSSLKAGILFFIFFIVGCLLTVIYSVRLLLEGYRYMMKYMNYFSESENQNFIFPVLFLFTKCWILGGFFYNIFLVSFFTPLSFHDLILGSYLLLAGFFSFLFLKFSYSMFVLLSKILFMRWFSTSGSSFVSRLLPYAGYENSWMEFLGGGGTFMFLNRLNSFSFSLAEIGLGWVIIFVTSIFWLIL